MRISLIIALAAALIDLVIGVTYGIISGWMGGKVDMVMQRIIEIIQSVPNLVVVTMLALLLGQGISSIIIAIGLFAWTGMARQVRNMVLSYKERDFVFSFKNFRTIYLENCSKTFVAKRFRGYCCPNHV